MKRTRTLRLLAFFALLIAGGLVFAFGREYLSFAYWKQNLESIRAIVEGDRLAWGATYFTAYVISTAFSIPGGILFSVVSGALFGFGWGLLIASFAGSMGADFACALTRLLFADFVREKYHRTFVKIDSALRREGAFYLFAIRLNPVFPYFLTNWLMGLTNMPLWKFHLISQLGMLPVTAIYVNAGVQLAKIESVDDLLSWPLLLSLAILGLFPLILKRYFEKKDESSSA